METIDDTPPACYKAHLWIESPMNEGNRTFLPAIGFEEKGYSDGTLYMRNRQLYWMSTTAITNEIPEKNVGYKLLHTGNFPKTSLGGATMTGTIESNRETGTWINGNKGINTIINSTANAGGFTMLAKHNSTNGKFLIGSWQDTYNLFYTSNTVINNNENKADKRVILLNEMGDTSFPRNCKLQRSKN